MQLVFKPQILIPFIILTIASAAVTEVSGFALDKPLNDLVLLNGNLPTDNLLGFFLFSYPLEIATLIIVGSIMFGVGVIAIMSVARMTKESGLVEAINDSVMDFGKTAGAVVLFWALFIIIAVVFTIAGLISSIDSTAGIIATWIFIIIIFIAFVKLFFTFPALIKKDLKKALLESWDFTNKRFWGSFALIIIAGIIAFVLSLAISEIGILIGGLAEVLLTTLGDIASITFFVAVVTNYFYSK